jgi:ligand-binding SRPBCC domain-containing protein
MSTLKNEIIIDAPIEKIWESLATTDKLDTYDPTVKKSIATSKIKSGIGASRKVDMLDGKNWFEEKCTIFEPNKALEYTLTACSFPVHNLKHDYSFEQLGNKTKVTQKMEVEMKYRLLGRIMFALLRSKWNFGNKQFLSGLKAASEKK